MCVCVTFFALLFAIYFFLFLSILYGDYTRDCSCNQFTVYIIDASETKAGNIHLRVNAPAIM